MSWRVHAYAVYALIAVALGMAAAGLALARRGAPRVDTTAFVKRSELDLSASALNVQANKVIRGQLKRDGLRFVRTTILGEKIDGAQGTVVARTEYVDGHGKTVTADLTLIFERSAWQMAQVTQGAPEGWAN